MGDDYFGFFGWFRNTRRLTLTDLDAAAEAAGLTPGEMLPSYLPPGRRYEVGVDGTFKITLNEEKNFSQFGVTGVTASHCLHRGPDTFASLVTSLAQRCDAILVRSFFPQEPAMVLEEELSGDVTHLDWYQYWGPTIVARWGVERLQQGPFHRVEALPNGACVIWMGADPFTGGHMSVKAAVEYLGIHPRLSPRH
jgi:hypothetical protein